MVAAAAVVLAADQKVSTPGTEAGFWNFFQAWNIRVELLDEIRKFRDAMCKKCTLLSCIINSKLA
jgi:hypothetical protein